MRMPRAHHRQQRMCRHPAALRPQLDPRHVQCIVGIREHRYPRRPSDAARRQRHVVDGSTKPRQPLAAERIQAIEQRLATITGKRVSMTAKVDKDIIGGVVARVGSTIYDASIATQLKKIRERLTT